MRELNLSKISEPVNRPLDEIRAAVAARVAEEAAAYGTGAAAPEHGKKRKFELVPAGELCSQPIPPRWLVRDHLETDCLAGLFGPSAGMKSFVALGLGLCVASGRDWYGQKIASHGPVIYICGEGFAGIGRRIKAWCIHNNVMPDKVPFHVSNSPVQFLDPESLEEAIAAVHALAQEIGAPSLVIVDTLARNFGPGDEDRNADMSRFIATLDSIRVPFGCAVLVVHHVGHGAVDRARGGSAFRAALDWEYRLEPKGDIRLLSCTKAKDFEPPQDMAFEPESVETGWFDEDGNPVSSVILQQVAVPVAERQNKALKGANKIALDALINACTKGDILKLSARAVDVDEWRDEAYRLSIDPSTKPESRQRAFRRAVLSLRTGGYVSVDADMYWPTDLPRRKPEEKPPVISAQEVEQLVLI